MVELKKTGAGVLAMLPHVIAAGAALSYAWLISGTSLRTSGLQFVMPALFVIAAHVLVLAVCRRLQSGFSGVVFRRSFGTAILIVATLFVGSVFGPKPAHADVGEFFASTLAVLFCVLVISVVVVAVLGVLWFFVSLLGGGSSKTDNEDDDDDEPRRPQKPMFDIGSLLIASVAIGGLSLEGLPKAYSFTPKQSAVSTRMVDASVGDVWVAMQTATSPTFPLPSVLDLFPRPVAVPVDEGVVLGANRVIRIEGREGAGDLHLRVMERTGETVGFRVLSDTSPIAGWIGFEALTYRVVPDGERTTLSVQLDFERKLAPAWFFGPMMRGASYVAADVLVRDVALRAELLSE